MAGIVKKLTQLSAAKYADPATITRMITEIKEVLTRNE